ncbi:hypothetical protein GCM10019993_05630 [Enterococcus pseudoavium]
MEWKDVLAKEYKLPVEEFSLMVVEALPTILNMLDRKDADKAERFMVKKGIEMKKNSPITEVNADHIVLKDGSQIPTHTLIWTAGVKGTTDAADFGLETARGQRLYANEFMQAKGYEDKDIYIVGDLVHYEENGDGRPTPQIVQAAEQTAHTAAANIVAKVKNTEKHAFKSNYQGFMVSIGSKWGVANLMDKVHLAGFMAIVMKHIVNLKYFFDMRSGYYMFQYMMHEFFHIKNDRNVTRGHSSRYGNVLWSVPLRVFYGLMWLVESSKKVVGDGSYLHPSTWFGSGSWFTDKVVFPFPWLQEQVTTGASAAGSNVAEATSAASGAVATGGADAATQATHFGLSYAFGENPMPVFEKMPHWFAKIMEVMMPNQEVALFMQKLMTFVEIGIALALIFGLFTWLASAATIGLTIVFCLSAMFYWVNIWFIFVAFALMNGSGRALGLDRWVIPWIQKTVGKWWYGTPKAFYGKK